MTIGRVLVTKQQPAEPNNFWCWLGSPPGAPPPNVEIGSLLVAEDEASQRSIIGMVDSLQHTSATLISSSTTMGAAMAIQLSHHQHNPLSFGLPS